MPDHRDSKIYSLRHWLFYTGVIVVLGTAIGAAHSIFEWSDGLTFAVGAVVGTITCIMSLCDDLFAPPRQPGPSRDRRA
jgi:hypothetical protein